MVSVFNWKLMGRVRESRTPTYWIAIRLIYSPATENVKNNLANYFVFKKQTKGLGELSKHRKLQW